MSNLPSQQPDPNEPPVWDREAARARYRRMMRSWPMRLSYLVLVLVILFAWGWGIAAAIAPDVETIPGHDVTVPTQACITCHTTEAAANNAPPMNHPRAPTCGFCHMQGVPQNLQQPSGWARDR